MRRKRSCVVRRQADRKVLHKVTRWRPSLLLLKAILAPALAALPEDDQAYFAEVPKGEYFDDKIDLFSASFIIHEDQPIIRDIEEECEQGEKA